MIKLLIFVPFLYFLAILQSSFLAHFNFFDVLPNLVLISIIFLSFFASEELPLWLGGAFAGGIFLDIFSNSFFGFNVLVLTGAAFFIKLILKRYVKVPIG